MSTASGILTVISKFELINTTQQDNVIAMVEQDGVSVFDALYKIVPDLTAHQVMSVLSSFYGYPMLDVSAIELDSIIKDILPISYILNNQVLPLSKYNNSLKLAITDPTNKACLEAISFKTGLIIEPILVEEEKLINLFMKNGNYFKTIDLDKFELDNIELGAILENEESSNDAVNSEDDDQPVVKFVHKMIFDAVQMEASDIHFEPYEHIYRVRYRVDGELLEIASPPISLKEKIAARIKIVAKLDISEKRIPLRTTQTFI